MTYTPPFCLGVNSRGSNPRISTESIPRFPEASVTGLMGNVVSRWIVCTAEEPGNSGWAVTSAHGRWVVVDIL